ncbi:MAG TPA: short-chain dehydrogenase [Microscillaceae bacterium]|nr:short-chain dehydrogenase [Microscillaceae bacterium]
MKEELNLNDKVAIVTGASKGIGESIVRLFAAHGAKVVVSSRKQAAVDEVAESIRQAGGDAIGIEAHMGKMDSIKTLVDKTIAHYGKIDIIVNNAATNPVFGSVENCDEGAFDKIMDVNVKGCFELGKLALPSMKAAGGGSIINMSSIGGLRPEPGLGIYSVSKAALIMLTKVMAKEWGRHNVRANVICPGLIKTKFSEALWKNEKVGEHFMKNLPIARIGAPEDIARLSLFLAADASSYSTGGVFTSDGGFLI